MVNEQSDCFTNKFTTQNGIRQGECSQQGLDSNYLSGCENNVITNVHFEGSTDCTGSNWQINEENLAAAGCDQQSSGSWMFQSCYNSDPSVTVPPLYPALPEGTTYFQQTDFSDNTTCTGEAPTQFQAFVSGACLPSNNTFTCNGDISVQQSVYNNNVCSGIANTGSMPLNNCVAIDDDDDDEYEARLSNCYNSTAPPPAPPPQIPGGWGYLTVSYAHEQSDCFSNNFDVQTGTREGECTTAPTGSFYYSSCTNNVLQKVIFNNTENCEGPNYAVSLENLTTSPGCIQGNVGWTFQSCFNSDPSVTVPPLFPAPPEGTTYVENSNWNGKNCSVGAPTQFSAFVSGACNPANVTWTCGGDNANVTQSTYTNNACSGPVVSVSSYLQSVCDDDDDDDDDDDHNQYEVSVYNCYTSTTYTTPTIAPSSKVASSNDDGALSGGEVAGIVIAAIVVLVGGLYGLYFFFKLRSKSSSKNERESELNTSIVANPMVKDNRV